MNLLEQKCFSDDLSARIIFLLHNDDGFDRQKSSWILLIAWLKTCTIHSTTSEYHMIALRKFEDIYEKVFLLRQNCHDYRSQTAAK